MGRTALWQADNVASVEEFEAQRPRLFALAYRMLGSAVDAEDIVQDAFLRWNGADHAAVAAPSSWLLKVATNLCLDRLTSARARREEYVGPWLPEPVPTDVLGPLETAEQRDSVSLAVLVLMERLTPTERAVFVLREAFGYSHRQIADIVAVSESNSRQLHSRGRQRVGELRPRFRADEQQWRRLVERFLAAAQDGDLPGLEELLADDVTSWSDGGGKVSAARRPIRGRDKVARYLAGGMARVTHVGVELTVAEVNGGQGVLAWVDGQLVGAFVPELADGLFATLHMVVNPDKLCFLARHADRLSHRGGLSSRPR